MNEQLSEDNAAGSFSSSFTPLLTLEVVLMIKVRAGVRLDVRRNEREEKVGSVCKDTSSFSRR